MPKILVTYFSQTGNTKRIAETIFETLEGEKVIQPINEIQQMDEYNLIFIGFPVHSHSVPFRIQDFIKKIPENKKIAFFSTHGSLTGSQLSKEALEHAVILASKAKVLGTFSCRGKVSLEALDIFKKSPEHEAWADMAVSAATHPDKGDLEEAKTFAKRIITLSRQP